MVGQQSSWRLCQQVLLGGRHMCRATTTRHHFHVVRPFTSSPVTFTSGLRREGEDLVSPIPHVEPLKESLFEILQASSSRWGSHTAVECGVTGKRYTYGELVDLSLRCGTVLTAAGVTRGQPVSFLMLNSPHFLVPFYGCCALGAVASPINPSYTPGEVARQVANSGAQVMVVDAILEPLMLAALAQLPRQNQPPRVLVMGPSAAGNLDLAALSSDPNTPFTEPQKMGDEDWAVLMYSSGTTGTPKGAVTSYGNIRHNLPAIFHPDFFPITSTTKDHQETVLGLLPFFHAYGLYLVLCASMALGSKVVTLPKFEPDQFLAALRRTQIGMLHLVPSLLQFLAGHPMVTPADLAYVRVALVGAAPCPTPAAQALKQKAPNPIFFQECYGMTETMPTHMTPLEREQLGSCGQLLPGVRARVVALEGGDGALLPPNTPGELWIKYPGVTPGYHNCPEVTADSFTADGWFKTGDVLTYDDDGFFYVVDRFKELIKVKGLQVSPSEIEEELLKMEGVVDVGVVGVDDPRTGEAPRAYVVRQNPLLTEEQVKQWVAQHLAAHKHLAGGVHFVDQLPKNQIGKLLRRELKEIASQE